MTRLLILFGAAALVVAAFGLGSLQTASAQGAPGVCLNVPAGEYNFTAPARDRAGEVSFTVTVRAGGEVVEFVEPGGQSVPASAMLQIFTGPEAYDLPDGVAIVECGDGAGGGTAAGETPVCVNLAAGTHEGTVAAGGRSYTIVMDVGSGGVVRGVSLLGNSYTAQEALDLLAGFGASLPTGVSLVECAAGSWPNSGSGGLADVAERGWSPNLWTWLTGAGLLSAVVLALLGRRRVRRG